MTRLKESDIQPITCLLKEYNHELMTKTGHSLSEIAAHAALLQAKEADLQELGSVAVIPVTSGQGIITGFSQTVAGILSYLGSKAFIPDATDVKGFAEALTRGAETVFLADDDRFIAVHLTSRCYSDNSEATGKGYAAALDCMTGGLRGKNVLVLGAGPVGTAAAMAIDAYGGKVHIYDKEENTSDKLAQHMLACRGKHIDIEKGLASALTRHRLIIVACPEAGFITTDYLGADSYVAAPGVPLGIHPEAVDKISPRLIHDPLQLGVATMCYDLLSSIKRGRQG